MHVKFYGDVLLLDVTKIGNVFFSTKEIKPIYFVIIDFILRVIIIFE